MDEPERLIARAALGPPVEALAAWREWRASVPIAEATDLLLWAGGYIHRNLRAAGVEDRYLAGIGRHNFLRNNSRLIAVLPVLRDLTARFQVTPLKSFGLSEEVSARSLRPLADVDFHIPSRQLAAARAALIGHGFQPLLGLGDDEFFSRVVARRGSWNHLDAAGADLDLHWRLFDRLGLARNDRLVLDNSRPEESAFGPIRRLDPELMMLVVATHGLQVERLSAGVFDAAHLLARSDPARLRRLIRRTGLRREMRDVVAALRDAVGDLELPGLRDLERHAAGASTWEYGRSVPLPPQLDRVPARFAEPGRWAHPLAARILQATGRPPWLERRLFARLGALSRPDVSDPVLPSGGARLGPGWHHRYPADAFRWADAPEARVVFTGVAAARVLRIELDAGTWQRSPYPRLRVLVNGVPVGVCDRSASEFEFPLPPHGPVLEVALRPVSSRWFPAPGIHYRFFRFLAPVRLLAVR